MPTQNALKKALGERIKADVPPDQFDPDQWDQTRLGEFYDDDIIKIDIAIFTTTEQAVHLEGLTLPDDIRRNLLADISVNTTPRSAAPKMFDAASRAVPIARGVAAGGSGEGVPEA